MLGLGNSAASRYFPQACLEVKPLVLIRRTLVNPFISLKRHWSCSKTCLHVPNSTPLQMDSYLPIESTSSGLAHFTGDPGSIFDA